jgi:hypothetical protein
MEGRRADALKAAEDLRAKVPADMLAIPEWPAWSSTST